VNSRLRARVFRPPGHRGHSAPAARLEIGASNLSREIDVATNGSKEGLTALVQMRTTLYVVQTFVQTNDGLEAEEPLEYRSAAVARLLAEAYARKKAGVLAWSKSGDPDTGEWDDDPVILFKAGRTGD
jgi:hypothetical protein